MANTATLRKGTIPIQILFVHPLKNQGMDLNKRRVSRSTGLTDWREAEKVKAEIDAILANSTRWHNLGEVSPITADLWKLSPESIQRKPINKNDDAEAAAYVEFLFNRNQEIEGLLSERNQRIADLEAQILVLTGKAVKTLEPRAIETAIEDFLSDDKRIRGTSAGARKKKQYRSILTRFAKRHPGANVHDLTTENVIALLADLDPKQASCAS